jgi:hypothetical protein
MDGVGPGPTVAAGAVDHFAIVGKIARLGNIDRAVIEPIAAEGRRGEARSNDAYFAEHQCLRPEL